MPKAKNPAAVQLGKLGGKARAEKLSPERRRQIAKKASLAAARTLTAEKRKEIALKGVAARQAKRKGKKK